MQKEQFTLLDDEGKPSMFAPIMIATLSTCAQLERENIKFRLNSCRQLYIEKGRKLGRKEGSTKSKEEKEISNISKSLRNLSGVRVSVKPQSYVMSQPQQFNVLRQNLICKIERMKRKRAHIARLHCL